MNWVSRKCSSTQDKVSIKYGGTFESSHNGSSVQLATCDCYRNAAKEPRVCHLLYHLWGSYLQTREEAFQYSTPLLWKFLKSFEQEGSAIQKDLHNPIWGGHRLLIIIRLATKKGGWEAVADCHLARPARGPSRSPSVWDFSYCKTGISGSKRQNPEPRCKAVVNGF